VNARIYTGFPGALFAEAQNLLSRAELSERIGDAHLLSS